MKREILFRGKRADNGELVYGSLITNYHEAITKYFITTNGMGQIYATSFEVIPETIGQFTGLTDKNGVKIFENDKTNMGVVLFENGCFGIESEMNDFISFELINLNMLYLLN